MPESADPVADARVLMRSLAAIDDPEKASVARCFLWMGIDLTVHQRAVALALLAELEGLGERSGVLDDMRLLLRSLREPIYPKKEAT